MHRPFTGDKRAMVMVVQGVDAAQLRLYTQKASFSPTIVENPMVKACNLIADIFSNVCRIAAGTVKTRDRYTAGL